MQQIKYDNTYSEFSKRSAFKKMHRILNDTESNNKINHLVNSFLVFAEKQDLIDSRKVTGINLESEDGQEIYEKLTKPLSL